MAAAVSLSARWETRLRISRSRPWLGRVLLLSLGLHLAVVLLLLFAPRPRTPPEPMLASPIAMMFLPPKQGARSAPTPGLQSIPATPSPAASPPRPAPALPPPPPAPPQPAVAPQPAPAPPPPTAQARVEPPAAEAEPALRQSPESAVPPPHVTEPRMVASNVPLRLPLPPPAAPYRPVPERHQPATAFPAPMAFSLGRPLAPARSASRPARASYGPAAKGPLSFGQFARVTAGHVDPSWLDQLHYWWDQHAYYPEQAVANGEDGTVGIQIVVDRYGHVRSVERESRSGSVWLDMAALGTFRDANLPPLPPDTSDPTITVDLSITYILVRR